MSLISTNIFYAVTYIFYSVTNLHFILNLHYDVIIEFILILHYDVIIAFILNLHYDVIIAFKSGGCIIVLGQCQTQVSKSTHRV